MEWHTTGFGVGVSRSVNVTQAPWVVFVVFAAFLILGSAFALGGMYFWSKGEASRQWPVVTGQVISAEVVESRDRSSHRNSSGAVISRTTMMYGAAVVYEYVFEDETHRSNRIASMDGRSSDYSAADRIVRRYAPGSSVNVYVNDKNPAEALLQPGAGFGAMLFTGMGILFALVGLGGLVFQIMHRSSGDAQDGLAKLK